VNAGTLTTYLSLFAMPIITGPVIVLGLRRQDRIKADRERAARKAKDAADDAARADEDRNVSWRSMNNALSGRNLQLQNRLDRIDEQYQKLIAEARDECEERTRRLQERIKSLESELAAGREDNARLHKRVTDLEQAHGGGRA
jgi:predicted RNase H-like nuclease (RuvC/YqgF family)